MPCCWAYVRIVHWEILNEEPSESIHRRILVWEFIDRFKQFGVFSLEKRKAEVQVEVQACCRIELLIECEDRKLQFVIE